MDKLMIGLEIHGYIETGEKLFCTCKNFHDMKKIKPNVNVCPICTGQPGSKPMLPNKSAIDKIMQIALMLGCKVNVDPEIIMFQEVEIVSSGASKSTNTGINEIVSVVPKKIVETESVRIDQNDLSELEEIYIRTVKVSKSKIFYFVPNPWGKKVLELEVTIGDKVYKETIKESASENIEGYRIEVGSLEDEDNIELNFKKA
jgi:hypothetical protein